MAKITDVYKKYKIMPVLQEHQLRVAAVAKQISDNLTVPIDSEVVIKACLLHDMGNILKFDLTKFPEFNQPEGREYWEEVKTDYQKCYRSTDEHHVSLKIAQELGASKEVLECIDAIQFGKATENVTRKELEPKICDYADGRVGPRGVLSLDDRLADLRRRYSDRSNRSSEEREVYEQASHEVEDQVFKLTHIKPADVTNESVAPIIEQLRSYEI